MEVFNRFELLGHLNDLVREAWDYESDGNFDDHVYDWNEADWNSYVKECHFEDSQFPNIDLKDLSNENKRRLSRMREQKRKRNLTFGSHKGQMLIHKRKGKRTLFGLEVC